MKILVTGGAGFIGSHIVDMLIEHGHTVTALDDLSSGHKSNLNARATFYYESVVGLHRRGIGAGYDAICHQAAQPSLLTSVEFPERDAEINVLGTIAMAELAKRWGAHLVLASTSAVYDADAPQPYTEISPLHPTRPYGIAKLSAENYARESGARVTVLRYGNVYGPRQRPVGENQLIPHALEHIHFRKPFVVNGDGEQTRDFVFVGDIARANVVALEQRVTGTFNIAHGVGHSVNKVLSILKQLTNFTGTWHYGPAKPREPRAVALNAQAALQALGWASLTPLIEGLGRTVAAWEGEREHA